MMRSSLHQLSSASSNTALPSSRSSPSLIGAAQVAPLKRTKSAPESAACVRERSASQKTPSQRSLTRASACSSSPERTTTRTHPSATAHQHQVNGSASPMAASAAATLSMAPTAPTSHSGPTTSQLLSGVQTLLLATPSQLLEARLHMEALLSMASPDHPTMATLRSSSPSPAPTSAGTDTLSPLWPSSLDNSDADDLAGAALSTLSAERWPRVCPPAAARLRVAELERSEVELAAQVQLQRREAERFQAAALEFEARAGELEQRVGEVHEYIAWSEVRRQEAERRASEAEERMALAAAQLQAQGNAVNDMRAQLCSVEARAQDAVARMAQELDEAQTRHAQQVKALQRELRAAEARRQQDAALLVVLQQQLAPKEQQPLAPKEQQQLALKEQVQLAQPQLVPPQHRQVPATGATLPAPQQQLAAAAGQELAQHFAGSA